MAIAFISNKAVFFECTNFVILSVLTHCVKSWTEYNSSFLFQKTEDKRSCFLWVPKLKSLNNYVASKKITKFVSANNTEKKLKPRYKLRMLNKVKKVSSVFTISFSQKVQNCVDFSRNFVNVWEPRLNWLKGQGRPLRKLWWNSINPFQQDIT